MTRVLSYDNDQLFFNGSLTLYVELNGHLSCIKTLANEELYQLLVPITVRMMYSELTYNIVNFL